MKKMAIFVEGQTERIFIERLLLEIAGASGLMIEIFAASGGGKSGPRSLTRIQLSGAAHDVTHFVMLVDCGADNRVRSDIGDNYENLAKAGYTSIIGIRDVYPDFVYADLQKLRTGLRYQLKTKPITVQFVLGVMEMESWFLAEHSHFQRLDASLTLAKILASLGFDLAVDDLQLRPNPAGDLHNAYQLAGFAYGKSRTTVQRTIDLLDYATFYLHTKNRFGDAAQLIATIDDFLVGP